MEVRPCGNLTLCLDIKQFLPNHAIPNSESRHQVKRLITRIVPASTKMVFADTHRCGGGTHDKIDFS